MSNNIFLQDESKISGQEQNHVPKSICNETIFACKLIAIIVHSFLICESQTSVYYIITTQNSLLFLAKVRKERHDQNKVRREGEFSHTSPRFRFEPVGWYVSQAYFLLCKTLLTYKLILKSTFLIFFLMSFPLKLCKYQTGLSTYFLVTLYEKKALICRQNVSSSNPNSIICVCV